jgi:hypothetical protein
LPSSYNKLKKRKEYKWSERGSCCVVWERELSPSLYRCPWSVWGTNIPRSTPHCHPALNSKPLEWSGPKECWWGLGTTAPWLGPLSSSFTWLASGWAWILVVLWIGPDLVFGWASWAICVYLQFCAFSNGAFSL